MLTFLCPYSVAMGNRFDRIVEGVYLGNIDGARDKAGLKQAGITHILTLRDNPEESHPGHFIYKLIDAEDYTGYNLSVHFDTCIGMSRLFIGQLLALSLDFIHEALLGGGAVMIHCMAGISRSTTVTCAYLMTATGIGMVDVLTAIKRKREVVSPNPGFLKQLRDYERDQLENARIRLVAKFGASADLRNRLETEIKAVLSVSTDQ